MSRTRSSSSGTTGGVQLGRLDHHADGLRPSRDPAADLQAGPLDAGPPAASARDEADPGAVQGRPPADEPGDDEALPGAQGQSAWLVPPDPPSAPVLHRALLPAARRRVPAGDRGRGVVPLHRQPRRAGDRRDAGRPDRPLRVDAAHLGARLDRHRGPDAAPDHARAAVRLRHLHHQLRGRPDRLLDHDERLDDRPAVPGAEAVPEARADRGETRRGIETGQGEGPRHGRRRGRQQARARRAAKGDTDGGPKKTPPPGPRKKKKRTGRRR